MEPCPHKKQIELLQKEVLGNGSGEGVSKKMICLEEKFNGLSESFADTKLDIKDIKSSMNILLMFKNTEIEKSKLELGFIKERKQDRKWFIVTAISMIGIFLTLIGIIFKLTL